jgi:hypothetical protein
VSRLQLPHRVKRKMTLDCECKEPIVNEQGDCTRCCPHRCFCNEHIQEYMESVEAGSVICVEPGCFQLLDPTGACPDTRCRACKFCGRHRNWGHICGQEEPVPVSSTRTEVATDSDGDESENELRRRGDSHVCEDDPLAKDGAKLYEELVGKEHLRRHNGR